MNSPEGILTGAVELFERPQMRKANKKTKTPMRKHSPVNEEPSQ
jgi:hypothetical protein